jgi:uncharacterized protein DUF6636
MTVTVTSSSIAGTASGTTSTSQTTQTVVAVTIVHTATFKSPTGNIGCMIIAGTARCDIKQRTWSPPPTPKSCPPIVNFGQGLIVTTTGPGHRVCAGDTTLDPSATPLAYNSDTVTGGFQCQSRQTGMTCTNTSTGRGFFISAQTYRTF